MATTRIFEGVLSGIDGNFTGIDLKYVGKIIISLLVLYILSSIFAYVQGYIMAKVSMQVSYNMRKEISNNWFFNPLTK